MPVNNYATDTALAASTGSSLMGYNQGSTGAATITQQAKNQQFSSVADMTGVDITGVADSTAGVQQAFNDGIFLFTKGSYLINGVVTLPAGDIPLQGVGGVTITFGASGQFSAPANATNLTMEGIKFISNSSVSMLKLAGTGGLFLNAVKCKFYSNAASTSANLINMVGVYGSMNACEFNAAGNNIDCVGIQAASANFSFVGCSSYGTQTRSFAYLDGSATAFGVQGIKFVGCLMLNSNNGIIGTAGTSGTLDGVQITGCMVDSMQVPLQLTNAINVSITGNYLGALSPSVSAVNLTNCISVSMSGNNGEMYSSTATWIYVNGGSSHSYTGNTVYNLHGKTSIFSGTLPSLMEAVGNSGTNNFISASPPQFDISTNLATTAWVAANSNMFSSQNVFSTSQTLTAGMSGSVILANSSSVVTFTMPSVSSMPAFTGNYFIFNFGSGTLTLSAYSGESIRATSLTIAPNAFIWLTNNTGSSSWIVTNRGVSG